ncbi:MAG: hypothetical protein JWM95_5494 [Gemmatimonadetes bacterium]|nr:hypothetical protein [Gemmatimonadota bacterium]
MRYSMRRLVRATVIASTLGCASHSSAPAPVRPERSVLTPEQIQAYHFETAYDVVEALRPQWLVERGPLSLDTAQARKAVVLVYLDNNKLGPVAKLREISTRNVSSMRRLDGVEAQARYGIGHPAGVIYVESFAAGRRVAGPTDVSNEGAVITNPANAADGFPLSTKGKTAPILISAKEFPGVIKAARDFSADVERVTGVASAMAMDTVPPGRMAVLVGTIGKSPLIDKLVASGKLNVKDVAGKWEVYVRQVVRNPMPGLDEALVIAGSDKRGTIYGIYDLSGQIGVSPWYYWADVPTKHQGDLFISPARFSQGEPVVKYRGIFINDEAPAFSGWAREKFGGVNHELYAKMFELILRMRGNYLWPAMWNNAFADDDSLNAVLADEYGIVMGTSHHEPMTRAQKEWTRYGRGAWDYGINDTTLRAFWKKGIERMGSRENIVTVGMRGDGDRPMTTNGESNITLLEKIVADQRKILGEVTGKDPSKTPTMWALYKEVQDYYDKGMRVPEDVTLLFSDDNWGNIRRLPAAADKNRSGSFGIYYHFDYVGGPRNYKWINTNPIARVWEQMHLATEYGANRIWVVNVGDLKPMEFPIQFFLDYAWDPKRIPASRLPDYTKQWMAQQFGAAHAAEIADLTTTYLKYAGRRKPELLAPETYSLVNYREAETVVDEYRTLLAEAQRVGKLLGAEYQDAYYELVLHPVQAAANLNEMYVAAAKNHQAATQQRASTNDYADKVRELFDRDAEISQYYNKQLAGGKWAHMMDQTHIGYTIWQEPPRNMMPRVDILQVPAAAEMAIFYEGTPVFTFGRGGGGGPLPGVGRGAQREIAFPEFDAYARQSYYIDVYNKGAAPFTYTVTAGQPWVLVSKAGGSVAKDDRVYVSVDWTKAPAGLSKVPVNLVGSDGHKFTVVANIRNPTNMPREQVSGFVESNRFVSMEAEHFTREVSPAPIQWTRIPDLGRTLSGMEALPVDAKVQTPGLETSARLEYRMFMFDSGAVSVRAYFSPQLNFTGNPKGVRYAISFDDEAPQVMNILADSSDKAWEQNVSDNVSQAISKHTLAKSGEHVLKFWMVDPGAVLQKIVVDAGGVLPSYLGPPESFRGTAKAAVGKKVASQ